MMRDAPAAATAGAGGARGGAGGDVTQSRSATPGPAPVYAGVPRVTNIDVLVLHTTIRSS